jgi:hypothetical protein
VKGVSFAGFASGVIGLRTSVDGAGGEVGVESGWFEFERVEEAVAPAPFAARLTRALDVSAPHDASAKTIPASSANRMIGKLSAGIGSPKARADSTRSALVDSSGIRGPSITRVP